MNTTTTAHRVRTPVVHVARNADLLLATRDAWLAEPRSSYADLVSRHPLTGLTAADLLRAFHEVFVARGEQAGGIHHMVGAYLESVSSPDTIARAVVEVQDDFPDDLGGVLEALIGDDPKVYRLLRTCYLALLREDVLAGLTLNVSRARYLAKVLDEIRPPLSSAERAIGTALATDWVGTIDELVVTARLLAQR